MADWKKAQDVATALLDKPGFEEPFVDVYKIADDEGIKIIPVHPNEDTRAYSGFLDTNGDKPVIYVNATESTQRQNWTIAHELGHYFLKHQPNQWGVNWRDPSIEEKTPSEQEADYFAACLLIPELMLKKVMNKYKLRREDVTLLAEMFGVSMKAMKNRLDFLRV